MAIYQQILVAVDGSSTSENALDEAIRLARLMGARLRLVHVIDVLGYFTGYEPAMAYVGDTLPLMRAAGEELLAKDKQKALDQGVSVDSVLVDNAVGRICEQVAEQAKLVNADLIVVGSHGRRGIGRALMGSDAELIVRYAPVPILVVRTSEAPEQASAAKT